MDFSLLFKFPGSLILIGIVLLIIAIIIGIIAYKTPIEEENKDDDTIKKSISIDNSANDTDVNNSKDNDIVDNNSSMGAKLEDELHADKKTIEKDNSIDKIVNDDTNNNNKNIYDIDKSSIESVFEDDLSAENNIKEENKKTLSDDSIIISDKEDSGKQESTVFEDETFDQEFDEKLGFSSLNDETENIFEANEVEEDKSLKRPLIEPNIDEPNNDEDSYTELLEKENSRVIYGGMKPLDDVDLDFEDPKEKELYATKPINTDDVPRLLIIDDDTEEKNDDIEML